MTDFSITVAMSVAALMGLGMASFAGLRAWAGWLDLKRLEIAGRDGGGGMAPSPTSRIELADLKERVRKLEGIAAGVDL